MPTQTEISQRALLRAVLLVRHDGPQRPRVGLRDRLEAELAKNPSRVRDLEQGAARRRRVTTSRTYTPSASHFKLDHGFILKP